MHTTPEYPICCHQLTDLLTPISDFLSTHSKEVVLLDLNHFYEMTKENHEQLLQLIVRHFGDLLMPSGELRELTLKQLWEQKKQVNEMLPFCCNRSYVQ